MKSPADLTICQALRDQPEYLEFPLRGPSFEFPSRLLQRTDLVAKTVASRKALRGDVLEPPHVICVPAQDLKALRSVHGWVIGGPIASLEHALYIPGSDRRQLAAKAHAVLNEQSAEG